MAAATYAASEYQTWFAAGLREYSDFADCVEFVNQTEYGDGQLAVSWWFGDDVNLTIYYGTFGNDNAPGADHYTFAVVYDDADKYRADYARWDARPEYLEHDDADE